MQRLEKRTRTASTTTLPAVGEMIGACIQCGTCSGSCPNEFAMDHTPRQLWRMVIMGLETEILNSRTFALCSSCYTCSLRCPRGLPLADAMAALKQIAVERDAPVYRKSARFYQSFLQSVRNHGRVREMEFMTLYFTRLKAPLEPLGFVPLGIRLMRKGKVAMQLPSRGSGKLAAIFAKVAQIEQDDRC